MFTKLINAIVFAVILSTSVANLAVARGGDGGGDHAGAHQIEDPTGVPAGGRDHGRDSGRPTDTREKSTALQCLQMIVVDYTIPNASEECGYDL